MARQNIATGAAGNDGSGDTLRAAGIKINDNFAELYEALGGDSAQLSAGVTLTDAGIKFEGSNVDDWETIIIGGNPSSDITLTLPTTGTELLSNSGTQTITNKTLTSALLTAPEINDTSADHSYVFGVSELTADRVVTLPLLTGADEFVFKDHIQTLTNKTLTSPVINSANIGTSFNDTNGAELIDMVGTASAANHIAVSNATATNAPGIEARGTDTNVDLKLAGKGTGAVSIQSAIEYNNHDMVADGAMLLTSPLTIFNTASALAVSLADGTHSGETKYFLNKGSATATITPANLAGGSTIAVAANEAGFMIWSGSNWHLASKTTA